MVLPWIARLFRWMAPIRKSTQEAADQSLAKQAKLKTFNTLTYETDLKQLAEDDREAVRQFRDKKMGFTRQGGSGQSNRDAIVCDDMTINTQRQFGVLEAAMLLGLVYLGWNHFKKETPSPPPPQPQVVTTGGEGDYVIRFWDQDGNPVDVPHLSQKPAE